MKTKVITDLFDKEFEIEVAVYLSEGYELKGFSHSVDKNLESWYSCLLVKDDDND